MRAFHFKSVYNKLLTPEVVAYLTQIHEYKGQQNLFIEAKADALSNLLEVAKIQSTEASNRIEAALRQMTGISQQVTGQLDTLQTAIASSRLALQDAAQTIDKLKPSR